MSEDRTGLVKALLPEIGLVVDLAQLGIREIAEG